MPGEMRYELIMILPDGKPLRLPVVTWFSTPDGPCAMVDYSRWGRASFRIVPFDLTPNSYGDQVACSSHLQYAWGFIQAGRVLPEKDVQAFGQWRKQRDRELTKVTAHEDAVAG